MHASSSVAGYMRGCKRCITAGLDMGNGVTVGEVGGTYTLECPGLEMVGAQTRQKERFAHYYTALCLAMIL